MNTLFITQDMEDTQKVFVTQDYNFQIFWLTGPWERIGKKAAKRHFQASVKNQNDWDDIKRARDIYRDHLRLNTWKKRQHGSTWFNNWRDWLDMAEVQKKPICHCGKEIEGSGVLCDTCFKEEYLRIRNENLRKRGVDA